MGYYSSLSILYYNPKVNIKKIKELEKYLHDNKDGIMGFEQVNFIINENSILEDINLPEYYDKFYETDLLAKKISKCIETGWIELVFDGEDNYRWGYRISKNKVEELVWEKMTESEYEEYQELKKFKPYLEVLKKLSKIKEPEKVIINTENGSGPYFLKFPKGSKAFEVKYGLKFLFNDLAVDLGIHRASEDYDVIYQG